MFEEAKAVGDEAAEVPVEDECQVRDSNISKSIGMVSIINLHLKCLECKYISYKTWSSVSNST